VLGAVVPFVDTMSYYDLCVLAPGEAAGDAKSMDGKSVCYAREGMQGASSTDTQVSTRGLTIHLGEE
jgi:hypothetical protein